MSIALFFIVVLLAELVAIKGGRDAVLNQVQNSSNIPAGSYIYDTLLAELKNMIVLAILIMAVIYLICILSGPSRVAVAFRRLIRLDKWHLGTPLGWWQTARLWVTEHRLYLMVGTIIGVLAVLAAFITINARSVTNSLLLLASILAVYQLMTLHRPNKAKAKTKAT